MPRQRPDIFSRWEKAIILLTACSLALLVAVQAAILFETPRRLLSQVDRLEGETVSWQTPLTAEVTPGPPATPAGYGTGRLRSGRELVLRLVQPPADPDIFLLVSGARQADFAGGEVRLTVYDGDYLEIDATRSSGPVRLVLHQRGLESPVDGAVFEGAGGLIPVGKVRLRS